MLNQITFRKAVIEAVMIAVGVFVALAVDNRNEDRKDRQLEQQFLEGAALDLTINIQHVTRLEEGAFGNRESLNRVKSSTEIRAGQMG